MDKNNNIWGLLVSCASQVNIIIVTSSTKKATRAHTCVGFVLCVCMGVGGVWGGGCVVMCVGRAWATLHGRWPRGRHLLGGGTFFFI
jgi:hypothetical protein